MSRPPIEEVLQSGRKSKRQKVCNLVNSSTWKAKIDSVAYETQGLTDRKTDNRGKHSRKTRTDRYTWIDR